MTALMKSSVLCLAPLLLAACSLLQSEPDGDEITLINKSGELVFFAIIDAETINRMDPIPAFDPTESKLPGLEAGASIAVGRKWEDVEVLIYAIRKVPGDEGPSLVRAVLVGGASVTHEELRRKRGRIIIRELAQDA